LPSLPHSSFTSSWRLFVVSLALTWHACSQDWVERKNQESDPARPLGWRFEVPPDWKQSPVPQFPFPLGEGWNGKDGSVQICWLGKSAASSSEQLSLEQRGYLRSERRVAGRNAVVLERKEERFCYVDTPQGTCRVFARGSNPVVGHILQSFSLLEAIQSSSVIRQTYTNWSFELPKGWTLQAPDVLLVGKDPVCKLSSFPLEKGQMLRGWARSDGKGERIGMEPFTTRSGLDGYLVEWKTEQGEQISAYVAQASQGLRFTLLRSSELERLRRLLGSLQFLAPANK
jgi:hypothetical protein